MIMNESYKIIKANLIRHSEDMTRTHNMMIYEHTTPENKYCKPLRYGVNII